MYVCPRISWASHLYPSLFLSPLLPPKQRFAATGNKIDESRESEPNSEVADHKANEPIDAKTLLAAENNCCVEGDFFFLAGGGGGGSLL